VTLTVPADVSSADGMSTAVQLSVREAFVRELGLEASEVQLIVGASSSGGASDTDASGSQAVVIEARVVLGDEAAAVQAKRDLDMRLGTVEEAASFFGGAIRPTEVPLVVVAPAAGGVEESGDEITTPTPNNIFLSLDATTLAALAAGGVLLLLLICCALRRATAGTLRGRFAVKPATNRVKPSKSSPSSPSCSLPEPVVFATQVSRLDTLTSTHGSVKLAKCKARGALHACGGGSSGHIALRDEVPLELGASHPPAPPQPLPAFVKGLSKLLPQQLGARKGSGSSSGGSSAGRKGSGLSKQGSSGILGVLSRQGSSKSYGILDESDAGNELTTHYPSGPHLESIADVNERCSVGSGVGAPSMRRDGEAEGGAEQSYFI